MQDFPPPFEYKLEVTSDGSPTLRLPPTWEPMHALHGAFTETLYIYQPAVAQALMNTQYTPCILSLGLGIGYNEVLVACEALKANAQHLAIDSYESVDNLRVQFNKWLLREASDLQNIYDQILHLYAQHYQMDASEIHHFLKQLLDEDKLQLHGEVTAKTHFTKSTAILFDAFSHKSNPELWSENFLDSFLAMAAADTCYLSTYASKGTLHRALKKHHFINEKKPGFGKKRESTFAYKKMDLKK